MAASIPASVASDGLARSEAVAGGTPPGLMRRLLGTGPGRLGVALTVVVGFIAVAGPVLSPFGPFELAGPPLSPPTAAHLMGTDALGRDLLSGVLHGTRTSLTIGAGVGVMVGIIGSVIGAVAGYFGGRIDDGLMRFTEVIQAMPQFFLAIVAIAMFEPGVQTLVVVLGLTSWVVFARVVRAEVIALRNREFVDASRAQGASTSRILLTEIIPNVVPVSVVYLALVVAHVILLEASLGFLGLGDPNVASLGLLARQAQDFLRTAWWMAVFPGVTIMIVVLGLNLFGDAWTEAESRRT